MVLTASEIEQQLEDARNRLRKVVFLLFFCQFRQCVGGRFIEFTVGSPNIRQPSWRTIQP